MVKLGTSGRRNPNESTRVLARTFIGVVFGFVIGISCPTVNINNVRKRCQIEWEIFRNRMADAEKAYYKKMGIAPPNTTAV